MSALKKWIDEMLCGKKMGNHAAAMTHDAFQEISDRLDALDQQAHVHAVSQSPVSDINSCADCVRECSVDTRMNRPSFCPHHLGKAQTVSDERSCLKCKHLEECRKIFDSNRTSFPMTPCCNYEERSCDDIVCCLNCDQYDDPCPYRSDEPLRETDCQKYEPKQPREERSCESPRCSTCANDCAGDSRESNTLNHCGSWQPREEKDDYPKEYWKETCKKWHDSYMENNAELRDLRARLAAVQKENAELKRDLKATRDAVDMMKRTLEGGK